MKHTSKFILTTQEKELIQLPEGQLNDRCELEVVNELKRHLCKALNPRVIYDQINGDTVFETTIHTYSDVQIRQLFESLNNLRLICSPKQEIYINIIKRQLADID